MYMHNEKLLFMFLTFHWFVIVLGLNLMLYCCRMYFTYPHVWDVQVVLPCGITMW